jgi:uncharacterized protein
LQLYTQLNISMNREKLVFQHLGGTVEGIYLNAGDNSPLVIIINGHNGFYNYGMFPYIQQQLSGNGISSYSFNFSHGGVKGDADYFEDLEKYEQNCMRLETEDLLCVLTGMSGQLQRHSKTVFLAHSLGGVPTIFGAKKALEQQLKIDGIILVSTVKTLNFWPPEMIKEWAANGVIFKKNNRTNQELPQGFEFLQEVLASEDTWNVERAIRSLQLPILIVHGEKDESVPPEHGRSLFASIKQANSNASLKIIPDATHTFNTKHPFAGPSKQLDDLISTTSYWIKKL